MNLIFLGPPGVGKGTQAKRFAQEYHLPHIATGDLLREAVSRGSQLGKKVKEIINQGKLVPDELVIDLVKERVSLPDSTKGFILDGFPRNKFQAQVLDTFLLEKKQKIDYVFYFTVNEEEIVSRLSARRICEHCQTSYNLLTCRPKKENICDLCGGELVQRTDDQPETIRKRLKVYRQETASLVEDYEKKGLLKRINAQVPIEEVYRSLKKFDSNV